MTTIIHQALHHLNFEGGELRDQMGEVFNIQSYSRFKYGHRPTAASYGYALAHMFASTFADLADDPRQILVTSAPYKFLPNASHAIATAFATALNGYRVMRGLEPTMPLHIVRYKVGTDSYSMSSPQERRYTLAQAAVRHIDRGLVQGSIVVAIDDVRITGSTQERIEELLTPCDPSTVCFLHVATLDKEQAMTNPGIEHLMNKWVPTSLSSIAADLEMGEFQLNSRVLRTIIETDDLTILERFFQGCSNAFLEEVYSALVGSTVEMYRRRPEGVRVLIEVMAEKKLPCVQFLATAQDQIIA